MKKRVISWLLCLALCLSMLPMAALAEDVQAPEGPAPSMNEPQPEPRAKENETPAPEPEKKVQSELMTAEKLLMPLASGETFSLSPIYVMQNSAEISDDITDTGVLKQSVNVVIYIYGLTKDQVASLLPATVHGIKASVDGVEVSSGGFYDETAGGWRHTWSFTPTKNEYTIDFSINYEGTEQTAQRTIKFESCKHPSRNNAGKCSQCGATLVAEINSATYYASLSEALDAAQTIDDCTITLLDDAGLSGDYTVTKGKFTIDLKTFSQGSGTINVAGTADVTVKNESAGQFEGNFCWSGADAKLTLAEGSAYANLSVAVTGKTVADLLPGGCGYQVSGNWVSESALSQTTIQNVLVKKAPFTVGDFSVNSSAYYINVPFTISASVRSSSFPNGHIDFDYCLYIDGIQKKTGNQNTYYQLSMDCTLEDGNQHTAKLVVSYNGYSVTKTLMLQAVACPHTIIGQTTGQCNVCKLQMAAYVLDKGKYVQDRRYYKTFKEALDNVWITLGTTDCTLGIFEDTTVSSAITKDLIFQKHTLTLCLNGKTLECTGEALFRALKLWDLIIQGENGTLKANSSTGVINASSGASLIIYGPITITNTNQNGYGIYTQGSSGDLANVEIHANKGNSVGSLYVNGGNVRLNSGTAGKVEVQGLNSLFYVAGGGNAAVAGAVTVQGNGRLATGYGYNPVFEDVVTIKSDGWASLRQGEFRKTLKLEPGTYNKTLRGLLSNGADDFYIGGVYQKDAKEQTEISADGENYVTIGRGHTHDYDDNGKCRYCDAEAEAKLYFEDNGVSKNEFGSFTTMLAKAQDYENSSLVLWKDSMLYSDATVTKGKFYISGGTKRLQSNGTAALVISGGDVQITEITVDRLKVKDTGKLTLNGGKYYAIDVTDSTYANYGGILGAAKGYKTASGWETASTIGADEKSFTVTGTPKEVAFLPLRSVTISLDGEMTVPYGTSVKFTATVESNSSSGITYKWFCDGVEIPDETTNELTVTKDIGSYEYRCDVTRDGYTLSSNTVQLTVQRIDLSSAALSATIQTRAYDGTTSAKIEDGSSLTLGNMTVPASAYTLSAVFADRNVGADKDVTVTVTLTNTNYCFGYDANKRPIMEETFETTGTITKNTSHMEQTKTVDVYSGIAHTYTIDLDACLSNLQNLGFESYEITEKNIVVAKLIDANQVVLEGHSLKIPVKAVVTAPDTEAAQFTITVTCKNYSNVTIRVRVITKDRLQVTASATPSKTELTYGKRLDTIALSGTTDPTTIQGTFAWQTPDAILDAGRHADLVWKFIPADYTYAEASGTAEIIVKQAKLTDPAPVTLTVYNGWAGTYEAALPELPTLEEGLRFGDSAVYGAPVVSADEYYSSGATLKMVGGKQGVSIPILKNETTKEGQVGTITVQYTSQNYEPVTLAINLVAKNRTAPTFILTADHDTLSGGGKVTLTLERGNLPDGAVVTVSGTDEAGNAVTLTDNGDGTYSATLPNKTQTYTFIAAYDGSQTIAPKTDFTTVKVQQRSSGGGEPAKPSFPVKISNSGDKKTAEIDLSGTKSGITDVTLPTDAVKKIVDSDVVSLTVKLPDVTVSFDDKALAAVAEQSSGADLSLSVNVGTANNSNLTDAQKNAITGARELSVIEVSLSSNGEKISNFNGGSVTIDVPFQWSMKGLLRAYYIDENGNKSAIDVTYKNGVATLVLNHFSTYVVEAVDALSFTDVSAKAYHFDAVAWAVKNKITSGQSDTLFAPDASCTRAQMVTFLWRANGSPEPTVTELPFTDVAADAYYAKAVLWAVENGITTGTSDTTFDPDGVVTRAEAVTFLWRSAGNPAAEGKLFADVESTKYYAEAVRWAVANGVTKGVSDTSFAPGSACTRAQIVTFLYRNCTNK